MRDQQWIMAKDICVSRDNIHRGIGKKLLQALIERLHQKVIRHFFAFVTTFPIRNEASLKFFRNMGCREVGEIYEWHTSSYMGPTNFIERLLYLRLVLPYCAHANTVC